MALAVSVWLSSAYSTSVERFSAATAAVGLETLTTFTPSPCTEPTTSEAPSAARCAAVVCGANFTRTVCAS